MSDEGWVAVCAVDDVDPEDVIGVEHDGRALAVYRSPQDTFHATDAFCTHERAELADGLVMGHLIECPKHNGRFDYTPARPRASRPVSRCACTRSGSGTARSSCASSRRPPAP